MKKKTVLIAFIAVILLAAVVAAGLHAVFTVAYIRASFTTHTPEGEVAAQELKEKLNTYLNRSMTFLDIEEVRTTAQSNPRFRIVTAEKSFPSTIVLEIEERSAAFVIRSQEGYDVIDNEGVRIAQTQSAENYVELTGDFSVSYENGVMTGNFVPELLQMYASFIEILGEPRANFTSISLTSGGAVTRLSRFRIETREGVEIVILNPSERVSELGIAAVQKYLSLQDAQRVRGSIVVQLVDEGKEVAVEYFTDR